MVMSSYGNGPGALQQLFLDLIGMYDALSYSCENVYDPLLPIVNSNDPYIYVDPWTGRIMKFDMHALLGMTVEWSMMMVQHGMVRVLQRCSYGIPVQDHQTIASSNMPAIAHPTTWMSCINGNAPHPLCSSSQDGGATWGPETSGAPVTCNFRPFRTPCWECRWKFYRGNKGMYWRRIFRGYLEQLMLA